jgi:hypothetical protein
MSRIVIAISQFVSCPVGNAMMEMTQQSTLTSTGVLNVWRTSWAARSKINCYLTALWVRSNELTPFTSRKKYQPTDKTRSLSSCGIDSAGFDLYRVLNKTTRIGFQMWFIIGCHDAGTLSCQLCDTFYFVARHFRLATKLRTSYTEYTGRLQCYTGYAVLWLQQTFQIY